MANCYDLFIEFNKTIRLSSSKTASLIASRDDLRDKIRKYFQEKKKGEIQPKFGGQGSYMMHTIINPITRIEDIDGKRKYLYYYDIDDGIYFIGDQDAEDRHSIHTYHRWICEAVNGHTYTDPVDKNTCVRVLFSDGHNIDFPIYYIKGAEIPELAHKAKGWIKSDPKEFFRWFNGRAKENPQLRRIVRYLKAWSDYRQFCRADKPMPSGLILTILASNHYYKHERDDIALKETLINIEAELKRSFRCERPTTPKFENLLSSYNCEEYFMDCLASFIRNAKNALEEKNQKKSCEYWQKSFGDRFPCNLAKDEVERSLASAGLALGASTSRPWGKQI